MSRGSCPYLLTMALAAPGAGHALGLGEIHIDSKLNQPLAAHIDLLGASDAELASLRAAIADRDAFQRAGLDRPAFLNSAQFSVSRDRQDRPVLTLQSRDSFTEPVIDLLVELHWPGGALIREYTLLLDPAGTADTSALNTVDAALSSPLPTTSAPVRSDPPATPVANVPVASGDAKPAPTHSVQTNRPYTVRPRDTLHGIARGLGASTKPEVRRLMMTLFHLNPGGFEGNINRLRSGVTLQTPTAEQLTMVPAAQVEREFRQQMKAWRMEGRPEILPAQASQTPAPQVEPKDSGEITLTRETDALKQRIAALEQTLAGIRQQIGHDDAQLQGLQQKARSADAAAAPAATAPATAVAPVAAIAAAAAIAPAAPAPELRFTKSVDDPLPAVSPARNPTRNRARNRARSEQTVSPAAGSPARIGKGYMIGAGLTALILGALAFPAFRRRRQIPPEEGATPAGTPPAHTAEPSFLVAESTLPVREVLVSTPPTDVTTRMEHDPEETLVIGSSPGDLLGAVEATARLRQDENLGELEKTAQHVFMEGELNSGSRSAPFVERRRSVIDILRAAIDKEPHRNDLKLKLLELYYATSAANLASFLDVAKKMAREPDMLVSGDWERIVRMGRALLPDEKLFMEDPGELDGNPAKKENAA